MAKQKKTRKINIRETAEIIKNTLEEAANKEVLQEAIEQTAQDVEYYGKIVVQVAQFTMKVLSMLSNEEKISFQEFPEGRGMKEQSLCMKTIRRIKGQETVNSRNLPDLPPIPTTGKEA